MKGVIVRFDAPKVAINGKEYEIIVSPMELHAKVRGYMVRMAQMNALDEESIRDTIAAGCAIIDEALGAGMAAKIAAGKPVSLPGVVKLLNGILDATNDAYREYVRKNYGGGR